MVDVELARFIANDYRGLPDAPAFELACGAVPVLVSAPHAVTHERDGKVKPSDDYTGSLALLVAKLARCHSIVACRYSATDPNWDPLERCAYKQAAVAHVREHGIKALVDIHGMVSASPALAALGTADGETVAARPQLRDQALKLLQSRLGPSVEQYGKPVVVDGRYAARGANTVASTVARECGIPCLQIELATALRVPSRRGSHPVEGDQPFLPGQRSAELSARRNPNPQAVVDTIGALVELVELLAH